MGQPHCRAGVFQGRCFSLDHSLAVLGSTPTELLNLCLECRPDNESASESPTLQDPLVTSKACWSEFLDQVGSSLRRDQASPYRGLQLSASVDRRQRRKSRMVDTHTYVWRRAYHGSDFEFVTLINSFTSLNLSFKERSTHLTKYYEH